MEIFRKHMSYLLKLLIPLKNWLFAIMASFASFLMPLQPLIITTTLISLLDWFIKLYCVYHSEGKQGIKSNKMQDTMYKIVLYAFFLFVLYTVDVLFLKTIFLDLVRLFFEESTAIFIAKAQLVTIGTVMILIREIKSIDENWNKAFGLSFINIVTDRFSMLIKYKKDDNSTKEKEQDK